MKKPNSNLKLVLLMTDSYKLTHWNFYPEGMTKVYSYLESRGGEFDNTLFFGMQYYLKYIEGVVVTMEDIDFAEQFCNAHFGKEGRFNREGWEYIVKRHGGKLPLKIKAVKEGTLVPVSNVLATFENTDDNVPWLTNVMETLFMKLWYPITVATNGFHAKQILANYLKLTGSELDMLGFKLHDFGYRGVSSEETAGIGGMSHLLNFMGTDTVLGIGYANKYYNDTDEYKMFGFSVDASEHSIACSFGSRPEDEEAYFVNMLESSKSGIVSIVSDTYDVFNFVKTMATKYKDEILNRDGVVVFRPDSGDPVDVNEKLIDILHEIFEDECTTTETGYVLLPPQVRIIQGDGIDLKELDKILASMKKRGYAADNWVFGSGGGLLQKFDRDTQKFAIKASYGERTYKGHRTGFDIQKDPVTSKGKKSKAGELVLTKDKSGEFITINKKDATEDTVDYLETVFENGKITRFESFEEIRERANKPIDQYIISNDSNSNDEYSEKMKKAFADDREIKAKAGL